MSSQIVCVVRTDASGEVSLQDFEVLELRLWRKSCESTEVFMKLVSTALEVHKWRGIILKIWIGCSIWENNGIAAKLFESMIRPLHYFTELIV